MPNIYLSICAILTFHCLLSDILSVVFVVSYYVSVTKMAFRQKKRICMTSVIADALYLI